MAEDDSMSTSEAGRKGGRSQGKENNPGNFANDREKARRAGQAGARAEPREAKVRGGQHSHDND
jgi:general stress protein YciG